MTDCSICLSKNGKIYRELGCGHRFHHKCLSLCQTKICPVCSTSYENIVLRTRGLSWPKSSSDKLKLKTYCDDIRSIINLAYSVSTLSPHTRSGSVRISERLRLINNLLKYIIDHKNMLNSKFTLLIPFIESLKEKINIWNSEIVGYGKIVGYVNINKQYITQFKSYSTHLLTRCLPK